MQFRLMLDRDHIDRSRKLGRELAYHVHRYIDRHTSEAVERATLRALGVVGQQGREPLTAAVLQQMGKERLRDGAAYWLGAVMIAQRCDAAAAAQYIVRKGFPEKSDSTLPHAEIRRATKAALQRYQADVAKAAQQRQPRGGGRRRTGRPDEYVIVATGDVGQDVRAVAEWQQRGVAGALVQPPLTGADTQLVGKGRGWRGRYDVLDAIAQLGASARKGGAVMWSGHHLMAPEIATQIATSPFSAMAYDCLTMAHSGGVHFKRAMVDQQFLYRLLAEAQVDVWVSSDRWRTGIDGYARGHEFLMGQIFIEAMGEMAGLPLESIRPSHGLIMTAGEQEKRGEIALHEVAHAQLLRELFPQVLLSFVLDTDGPPAHLAAGIANLCDYASVVYATHTADKRAAAQLMERQGMARQMQSLLGGLSHEINFVANGAISRRTHTVLERVVNSLEQVHRRDFLKLAGEQTDGLFVLPDRGAGIDGVYQKNRHYWNPLEEWLRRERQEAA